MAHPSSFDDKWTMICLLLVASCLLHSADGNNDRSRLYTKILMDYESLLSPNQGSDPVTVNVALSLQHVGHLNEATGTLKVNFGLYQSWTDENTVWNRTEFNISSIFLPRHSLWAADTVLHKGEVTHQTISKDILIFANGQVADVNIMDVSLPCDTRKSIPRDGNNIGSNKDIPRRITRVCTLIVGCAIRSRDTILYKGTAPDITGLANVDDTWQLDRVDFRESMQSRPSPHDPIGLAIFDFILVKNATPSPTLTDTPYQLVAPTIMTSLAALGVFFLPPMAGERILMIGVAFLGQLILAGFSVLAQIQTNQPGTLYNFMLFSTVYIFLIMVAVLSSFFAFPLLKRFNTAEETTEEDGVQLLTLTEKKFVSKIPDVILFIIFIVLYSVGMVTIFF